MPQMKPVNTLRTSDNDARQAPASSNGRASTQAKDTHSRWNVSQAVTALVGVAAALQGLKPVGARSLQFLAAPSPTTVPALTPAPAANVMYEMLATQLPDDSFICLQGLAKSQLQHLSRNNSTQCGGLANVVWNIENNLSSAPDSYSDIVQFEVPDTQECCLVYSTTSTLGCSDLYPSIAHSSLTGPRSCATLSASIDATELPDGGGECSSATGEHLCITETNYLIAGSPVAASSPQVLSPAPLAARTPALTPAPVVPATTATPARASTFIYEVKEWGTLDSAPLCTQGLSKSQLQSLAGNTAAQCGNFAEVVWDIENEGLSTPYAYNYVAQFEIPETEECCLVYQTTNSGCEDLYPKAPQTPALTGSFYPVSASTVPPRSCEALGIPVMTSIITGAVSVSPTNTPAVCQGVGAEHECLDELNMSGALPSSTPAGPGGPPVSTGSDCGVSGTGTVIGNCGGPNNPPGVNPALIVGGDR